MDEKPSSEVIDTIADLLSAIVRHQTPILERYRQQLGHPTLVGDMYEGLTRDLLDRAVFKGLGLKIRTGKIRNSQGTMSRQIDCMLVRGEGERVPHTDHWIHEWRDVVAVIEVKTSLYGKDLDDALALFHDLATRVSEPTPMVGALLRDAWRSITLTELPEFGVGVEALDPKLQMVFHALVVDANLPVRVILGYDGFVSEHTLREGIVKQLTDRVGLPPERGGIGPVSLPNLILCGQSSIIKLNGMPYTGEHCADGSWWLLASQGHKPFAVLLQVLWTWLTYYHGVGAEVFGQDLEGDQITLLLRVLYDEEHKAWGSSVVRVPRAALREADSPASWEPATLSMPEFVVMNELCRRGELSYDDPGLREFLAKGGLTVEQLAEDLRAKRLAHGSAGKLQLLTRGCACVILPDGRMVAGENSTGRLERWVARQIGASGTPSRET